MDCHGLFHYLEERGGAVIASRPSRVRGELSSGAGIALVPSLIVVYRSSRAGGARPISHIGGVGSWRGYKVEREGGITRLRACISNNTDNTVIPLSITGNTVLPLGTTGLCPFHGHHAVK